MSIEEKRNEIKRELEQWGAEINKNVRPVLDKIDDVVRTEKFKYFFIGLVVGLIAMGAAAGIAWY